MKLTTVLSILLTLILGYLLISSVDWQQFVLAAGQVDIVLWLMVAPLFALVNLLKALRWHAVLIAQTSVSKSEVFRFSMIGLALNDIIPARIGEFYRAYLLSRKSKSSYPFALASVVLERIFDGLFVVALLAFSLMFIETDEQFVLQGRNIVLMVFGGLALFIMYASIFKTHAQNKLLVLLRLLPQRFQATTKTHLIDFFKGLSLLGEPKTLLRVSVYTALLWAVEIVFYYLMFVACSIEADLSFAMLTISLVSLAVILPSSPGYIGVYHFACVTALVICGVDENRAMVAAVILNITELLVTIPLGLYFFSRMGLKWPSDSLIKKLGSKEKT